MNYCFYISVLQMQRPMASGNRTHRAVHSISGKYFGSLFCDALSNIQYRFDIHNMDI